jgi:hypothetical protein
MSLTKKDQKIAVQATATFPQSVEQDEVVSLYPPETTLLPRLLRYPAFLVPNRGVNLALVTNMRPN